MKVNKQIRLDKKINKVRSFLSNRSRTDKISWQKQGTYGLSIMSISSSKVARWGLSVLPEVQKLHGKHTMKETRCGLSRVSEIKLKIDVNYQMYE